MPTPTEIIDMVASLQNDTAKSTYTDVACLPYLNMALSELQEVFEHNNVPITNEVSATLVIPAGTTRIAFAGTTPVLPSNLIDIQQVWESLTGQTNWIPMTRKEFIPHYEEGVELTSFNIWAWIDEEIKLPSLVSINDLKIDYIKKLFVLPILIADVGVDLPVLNSKMFLGYKTAALCSFFIGENETRAGVLNNEADVALNRTLGISSKGRQAITTRRRPFRSGYKRRGIW